MADTSHGFLSSSLGIPVSSPTLSLQHPLVNWGGERKVVKDKSSQEYAQKVITEENFLPFD